MKKILILIMTIVTILSCSNDDDSSINSKIIGNWNWTESSGGIDGRTATPESTGSIKRMVISKNTIKKYLNGNLKSELIYSIELEEYNGELKEMIIYQNKNIGKKMINLSGNHLIISDICPDCFQNEYDRE